MPTETKWMPVFVVWETFKSVYAAHPEHKGEIGPARETRAQDYEQRIGTAYRQDDGSYVVQLTALPVSGRLLIRPPGHGEHQDPTFRED